MCVFMRKIERKLSSMLKLSVVKVFPCVLMFSVKPQLRGFKRKSQEKIKLHLRVSSLFISALHPVKPCALLMAPLMLAGPK